MTLITNAEELAAFEPQWLALCRRTPGATPFQTPMWLLPWWRHFGSNDLAVIVTPEAIAPLYIVREDDESLGMFLGTRMFGLASDAMFRRVCLFLIAAAALISLPVLDSVLR